MLVSLQTSTMVSVCMLPLDQWRHDSLDVHSRVPEIIRSPDEMTSASAKSVRRRRSLASDATMSGFGVVTSTAAQSYLDIVDLKWDWRATRYGARCGV